VQRNTLYPITDYRIKYRNGFIAMSEHTVKKKRVITVIGN